MLRLCVFRFICHHRLVTPPQRGPANAQYFYLIDHFTQLRFAQRLTFINRLEKQLNVNIANKCLFDISWCETVMKKKAQLELVNLKRKMKQICLLWGGYPCCWWKCLFRTRVESPITFKIISHLCFYSLPWPNVLVGHTSHMTCLRIVSGCVWAKRERSGWQIRTIWHAEYFTLSRTPQKIPTWVQINSKPI